jgi:hypothetical protein
LAKLKPRNLPPSRTLIQKQKEIVEVIQSWQNNKLGIFAENFFLDQSLDAWKQSSSKLLSESGKLMLVGPIVPENQLCGTFIIECEMKNIEVFFTLTPEHSPLIQQLDLTLLDKK